MREVLGSSPRRQEGNEEEEEEEEEQLCFDSYCQYGCALLNHHLEVKIIILPYSRPTESEAALYIFHT